MTIHSTDMSNLRMRVSIPFADSKGVSRSSQRPTAPRVAMATSVAQRFKRKSVLTSSQFANDTRATLFTFLMQFACACRSRAAPGPGNLSVENLEESLCFVVLINARAVVSLVLFGTRSLLTNGGFFFGASHFLSQTITMNIDQQRARCRRASLILRGY